MVKITNDIITRALEVYVPECRYLIDAKLNFPEINGIFRIPNTFYTAQDSQHLNAVELLLCYNQLSRVMLVSAKEMGLFPEVNDIPLDEFLSLSLKNGLIVKMNKMKFKKSINRNEFGARIKINNTKNNDKMLFFKTEYDFENGKQTGNIDLAFILGEIS